MANVLSSYGLDVDRLPIVASETMPKQLIITGIPGSGKSWYVKNTILKGVSKTNYVRVVFYDGYDYTDFIGGFRPTYLDGQASMSFIKGPFLEILCKALKNPIEQFYVVIEEINIGNAPLIFGDFFQLLDRNNETNDSDYGWSMYTLHNDDIKQSLAEDGVNIGHGLRLPSNFNIIATMNSADQNTYPLDTAFKRRFSIKYCINEWDKIDENITFFGKSWKHCCKIINNYIINDLGLPDDMRIGCFFVNCNDNVEQKIVSYLYDDIAYPNGFVNEIFSYEKSKEDLFHEIEKYNISKFSQDVEEFTLYSIFNERLAEKLSGNE